MEYEKTVCPIVDIDGKAANGKQFDLDITIPEDGRDVIYGVVHDCHKEPICDAVVKLIEVVCECGKEEHRPVSHTFTDKDGEFVFGPLCPNRTYEVEIWVNQVKHGGLNFIILKKRQTDSVSIYLFYIGCPFSINILQYFRFFVNSFNFNESTFFNFIVSSIKAVHC